MRTGLELELLAPIGLTRFDLARSLAAATGGELSFGLKHVVDGFLGAEQRPRCSLSLAAHVKDRDGDSWASFVDDVTIRDELATGGDERAPFVIVDDTRIAKWL